MTTGPWAPAEIWLQIFRHATEDPSSSLERFQLGPNDEYHRWRETQGYRDSLATKLAIAGTCRGWNALAIPLLCEHVTISNHRQYGLFHEALTRGETLGARTQDSLVIGASGDRLRRLVTRLDLFCSDKQALGIAVRLCELLPELQSLVASLAPSEDDQPSVLFNALPPRLRHFFWMRHKIKDYNVALEIELSCAVALLQNLPELTTISIPFMIDCDAVTPSDVQAWSNLRWPSIRTLVLQHCSQAQAAFHLLPTSAFPNLRWLNGAFFPSETDKVFVRLLSAHAQNVTVLSFDMDSFHGSRTWRPSDPGLLRKLADPTMAFAVHELHLCGPQGREQDWLHGPPAKPMGITTLCLHIAPAASGVRTCREITTMHLFVALPWTNVFPKVTIIRVVESVDLEFYKLHDHVTQEGLAHPGRWVRQPIRVEDISGRLLSELSSGVSVLVGVPPKATPHCNVSPVRRSELVWEQSESWSEGQESADPEQVAST